METTEMRTPSKRYVNGKKEQLAILATELKHFVEQYYSVYKKPVKYRELLPRFAQKLPEGIPTIDFVAYLEKNRFVTFFISFSGKRYVFPELLKNQISDDDMMEQVQEIEQLAAENRRATARMRKKG